MHQLFISHVEEKFLKELDFLQEQKNLLIDDN